KDTVAPTQSRFTFKAPEDGEYWFTIVSVDKSKRLMPPDITREPPAFVVVVDTQPPEVTISGPADGSKGPADDVIHCELKDANPNPASLKCEYQTADKKWHTLEPLPNQPETFRCPERTSWTGQVRVSVADLAKNVTVREASLTASAVEPPLAE